MITVKELWQRLNCLIADKMKIYSDGIEGHAKDGTINRKLHDYKRYQVGIHMVIIGWWYIDKIDDDKQKNLVWKSLVGFKKNN